MKLDKLLKRLKRDAAASPQKAGALGLMVLVALYFWAPLVLKNFKGKSKPGAPGAARQVILGDDPLLVKAAVHPASDSQHWDRIREVLAQDQLMQAAMYNATWENPFQPLQPEEPADAKAPTAETTPDPKLLPATPKVEPELAKQHLNGVSLSSVIVGQRGTSAVIRGKLYRVGDVLAFGGDAGAPKIEFRIVAIDELGVDLKYDDQKFRLERARPALMTGELQRNQAE